MQQITLKGGNVHYTDKDRAVYSVIKGPVLVYLIPLENGEEGRRLFLGEFGEGRRIPGFHHSSDAQGEWIFGLVAMDIAALIEEDGTADEELLLSFAETAGIRAASAEDFDSEAIEKYETVVVKEMSYIYAAGREKKRIKERNLTDIYDFFDGDRYAGAGPGFTPSGKAIYDAAAFLCAKEKISIAPMAKVTEACGRRYGIHDIARVSHFVIREIVLEKDWYRDDTGSVLAFRMEDDAPVACISRGPRKHLIYDPKTGRVQPLDRETASGLKPRAFMFYRPFPEKPLSKWDVFRFGMQKVYPGDIVRLLVLALAGTLVGLLIPYLNEQVFDKFIPAGNTPGLVQFGAVLLACSLGNISFTIVKNLASFRSMNAMEYAVQSAAFDRLFNLPESFFRKYDAADLGQRVLGLAQIYNVLAQSLTLSLLSAVFSLLYLWRMFKYSKSMSVWAMLMIIAVMALMLYLGFRQIRYEMLKSEADRKAQSISFQNLTGISKIRSSWSEDRAIRRYLDVFLESRRINRAKEKYTRLVNSIAAFVQIFFSIVFYYLMIRKDLGLTIGQFSAFTAAFSSFSSAMITIVQNFLTVNQIKPIYDDARPILETLPELSEEARLPGDIEGEIEVNNISFSYSPEEAPVLEGFSLHIMPGEYVGIVGSSGCGKSTLMKLLLGFEKPQRGVIYYDRADINELDKRELRKKFGVVLQDGGLITGSIYDNITITAPNVSKERVDEVVREVGLEDDIKKMPMGLHTVVAEGAGTISGGQAQRILIARALVGRPKIMILDEATSALDNVTQNQVVETLEKIDATKIVVAHRLSTVRNCDRIIVMDKGRIAEEGTYEELMAKKGLFHSLAVRQIS